MGIDSTGSGHPPSLMLLLLLWLGHVEVMAAAILWFIGHIEVVGVVLVVVVALVYQILVSKVF